MAKHKTTKGRRDRQKVKARYTRDRETLQLHNVLPTVPEGAVRSEVVDPASQDEQRFPGLDRLAIREDGEGWSVPESVKRKVIESNAEVLYERRTVLKTVEVDGQKVEVEVELPPDREAIDKASRILLQADSKQHERDHPEQAGKGAQVNVAVGVDLGDLLRRAEEQRRANKVIDVENKGGERAK